MKVIGNTLNRNQIASLVHLWENSEDNVLDRNRCRRGLGFGATVLMRLSNDSEGCCQHFSIFKIGDYVWESNSFCNGLNCVFRA